MRAQVEIELVGVDDSRVDDGSRGNIAGSADGVTRILAVQACMMAFLHDDERDAWLVVLVQ